METERKQRSASFAGGILQWARRFGGDAPASLADACIVLEDAEQSTARAGQGACPLRVLRKNTGIAGARIRRHGSWRGRKSARSEQDGRRGNPRRIEIQQSSVPVFSVAPCTPAQRVVEAVRHERIGVAANAEVKCPTGGRNSSACRRLRRTTRATQGTAGREPQADKHTLLWQVVRTPPRHVVRGLAPR